MLVLGEHDDEPSLSVASSSAATRAKAGGDADRRHLLDDESDDDEYKRAVIVSIDPPKDDSGEFSSKSLLFLRCSMFSLCLCEPFRLLSHTAHVLRETSPAIFRVHCPYASCVWESVQRL